MKKNTKTKNVADNSKKRLSKKHKIIIVCISAAILIALALVLILCGAEKPQGPFSTELNSKGEIIVTGLNDKNLIIDGHLDIPENIDGKTVAEIGNAAFYALTELTSVTIPESVSIIGSNAFESCTSLKSIRIPKNVTVISNYTFQGCISLENIDMSDSKISAIGDFAFYKCEKLASVELGDRLESIGNHSFAKCTSLSSLVMPSSLLTIDKYAFLGCEGFADSGALALSGSIVKIGEFAFNGIAKECISAPDGSYAAAYIANLH